MVLIVQGSPPHQVDTGSRHSPLLVLPWADVSPRARRWIDDCVPGCPGTTSTRRLVISEHLLGLSWALESGPRATGDDGPAAHSRRIVLVETVGPRGSRLFAHDRSMHVGHPAESSRAYRWLGSVNASAHPLTKGLLASSPPPCDAAWTAVRQFRSDALDSATRRLRSLERYRPALEQVHEALLDTVAPVFLADPTGRIAQMAAIRPWMIDALAVAHGDDQSCWLAPDGLSRPLRLVVEGASDRKVLTAALDGIGDEGRMDHRLARLSMFARRRATNRGLWNPIENRAHIAAALDVDCPASWVAANAGKIDRWSWAQCWAAARAMPRPALRYVARYGVELHREVRRISGSARDRFEAALRSESEEWMRNGLRPYAAICRVLNGSLPCPPRVADTASVGPVTVTRVVDGRELRRVGRQHANCLVDHAQWMLDPPHGVRVYFHCAWKNGSCVACVRVDEAGASLDEALKAENAWLTPVERVRVVRALEAAVPALFDGMSDVYRALGVA